MAERGRQGRANHGGSAAILKACHQLSWSEKEVGSFVLNVTAVIPEKRIKGCHFLILQTRGKVNIKIRKVSKTN